MCKLGSQDTDRYHRDAEGVCCPRVSRTTQQRDLSEENRPLMMIMGKNASRTWLKKKRARRFYELGGYAFKVGMF